MSGRGNRDENSAVMHGDFMAFAMDEVTFSTLRKWAERQGYPSATVQMGGPDMFAHMLESAAPPKLSIIDIDGQTDPVSVATRLVSLCGTDNKIIALGSANDVSLYRRFVSAGVVDYIVKPITHESLSQAMTAALRSGSGAGNEAKESKTVIVIGTRGGVGATTIAVNLGWVMAHDLKLNCALLDLDMQFGTSSLSLDLEPGRGLRDIVSSPNRVDGLMIASSMASESDQFSVLGAEEAVDEHVEIDSSAITALLKEMKSNFDFVLVDLPRHLLASQKRLLTSAHNIILVTELSLAGIRDTLRIKTAIHLLAYSGTITIVASRVGPSQAGQLDQAAFEKGALVKVDFLVPEDHKTMTQAANTGKAIAAVSRQSAPAKVISAIAIHLHDKAAPKDGKSGQGFWSKLTGKGASKKKANKSGDQL